MSEQAGKINEYVCQKCGDVTRTVNRDTGITPFMIICKKGTASCKGAACSSFYRVSQNEKAEWQWIRPTPAEFEQYIRDNNVEECREALEGHCGTDGMLLVRVPVEEAKCIKGGQESVV